MKVRFVLFLQTFFMFFIYQMSRFNINIAIVAISKEDQQSNHTLTWDTKPLIMGAFFYICWITELTSTFLFAKFGCRSVMTVAILISSVSSFLFPFAYKLHPMCAFVIRAMQGLCLGTIFPAMAWLSSRWSPKNERARFMSAVHGGAFGASVTNLLGGIIIDELGWPYLFHATGLLSIIWVAFWWTFAYDSPAVHPKISAEELEYLKANIESNPAASNNKSSKSIPWLSIFTSRPFWAIFIMFFCLMWLNVTLSMQMPTYFDSVHSLSMKTNGILLSLPDILKFIVGIKFPMIVDNLVVKGKITITTARKLSIGIGYITPGIMVTLLAFFGTYHVALAAGFLITGLAVSGAGSSSILANVVDISPNYSGFIMGICKTASNIPGVVSPIIVKLVVSDGDKSQWQIVFLTSAIFVLLCTVFFLIFSSTNIQPWNSKETEETINENLKLMEKPQQIVIVAATNEENVNLTEKSQNTVADATKN